jgi:hypothetical protein
MEGRNSRLIIGGTHDGDGTSTTSTSAGTSSIDIHGGTNAGQARIRFHDSWFENTFTVGAFSNIFEMTGAGFGSGARFLYATAAGDLYLGNPGKWVNTDPGVPGFKAYAFQGAIKPAPNGMSLDGDTNGNMWNYTRSIIPIADGTYSLGSTGLRWYRAYIDTIQTTNEISTSYTVAKCTDANADQTSANYAKGVKISDKDDDTTCYPVFTNSAGASSSRNLYADHSFKWDSQNNKLHCNVDGDLTGEADTVRYYRTVYNAGGQTSSAGSFALGFEPNGNYYNEHYVDSGNNVTGSDFVNLYHHHSFILAVRDGAVTSVTLRFRYGDIGTVHFGVWKHPVGTSRGTDATQISNSKQMSENGTGHNNYYYWSGTNTVFSFNRGDILYCVITGVDNAFSNQIYEAAVEVEYDTA